MCNILQLLYVRLKLFEQHKPESNKRLRVDVLQVLSLFNLINVQVDVTLPLQNSWILLNKVLNELRQQQYCLRVPRPDFDELIKQFLILIFLHLHVVLGCCHLVLDGLDPLIQIILQIILIVICLLHRCDLLI